MDDIAADDIGAHEGDDAMLAMFSKFDVAIKEANTQAIGAAAGQITKDDMLRVAIAVSRFRANYLAAVLRLAKLSGTELPSQSEIAELRRVRLVYEEGLEGFGALRHALGRGYFSLASSDAT
jgi:hypothetical protein